MSGSRAHDATYVTVADERFFLGAVALVNSLRLSGNPEPIVVMDAGLSSAQRALLSDVCDVRPLPVDQRGAHQTFLKPAVMLELSGTAVWIDSDIIVTDRLEPILADAASGRICAFPDGAPENHARRVDEWVTLLGLGAELRPQVYVNAGFLAFRVDLWDGVVRRWWDLCDRVRVERSRFPHLPDTDARLAHPFAYLDQDVLNGLLMSEVERESIHLLDWRAAGVADIRGSIRVVDVQRLRCQHGDVPTVLLHDWLHPKPWFPDARGRFLLDKNGSYYDAYEELMARLLTSDDAPVRVPSRDVPVWLRTGRMARLARRGPRRAREVALGALERLPEPVERWGTALGRAVTGSARAHRSTPDGTPPSP